MVQVLASSCLPQQTFNISSNLLTHFEKTAKQFALVAQTHKKYSQNCYDGSFWRTKLTNCDFICHVAKVEVARSVHSMADVDPFLSYLKFGEKVA